MLQFKLQNILLSLKLINKMIWEARDWLTVLQCKRLEVKKILDQHQPALNVPISPYVISRARQSFPERWRIQSILENYFSRYNFATQPTLAGSWALLDTFNWWCEKKNALIYYDLETESNMIAECCSKLAPDGCETEHRAGEYTWGTAPSDRRTGNTWSAPVQPWTTHWETEIQNIF